MMNAIALK